MSIHKKNAHIRLIKVLMAHAKANKLKKELLKHALRQSKGLVEISTM